MAEPVHVGSTNRPRNGGPHSDEGKQVSRANAIKHGLTARRLLPEVLKPGRVAAYRQQLEHEFAPTSVTEHILIDEIARHAAALELSQEAEGAVLRQGAQQLAIVMPCGDSKGESSRDVLLAAAVASEALERSCRYRRGHEKGMYKALETLRGMRALSCTSSDSPGDVIDRIRREFPTEAVCKEYLRGRFGRPDCRCPDCGYHRGHWLVNRNCWECGRCRRQTGARYGTVMYRSPLPLCKWFRAIGLLVLEPNVSTVQVGTVAEITRQVTVAKMVKAIRTAILSDQASDLLAGLDEHFARRCLGRRP